MSAVTLALITLSAVVAAMSPSPVKRLVTWDSGQTARPRRPHHGSARLSELDVADDLELFAEALSAGMPPSLAAHVVADAAAGTEPVWRRATALMNVGVRVENSFEDAVAHEGFAHLARMLKRSAASGAAMADGCRELAVQLRSDAGDQAVARAERAGVFLALPMTGCFLPAFFVLGLAPVIVSLGSDLFNR